MNVCECQRCTDKCGFGSVWSPVLPKLHGLGEERLRDTFGVDNSALAWFRSYLAGRRQHVRCGGKCSVPINVTCGVDRRRTWFITALVRWWQSDIWLISVWCHLSVLDYMSWCLDSIASWMRSNHLQLNTDKTEVMWCTSTGKLLHTSQSSALRHWWTCSSCQRC